MSEGEEREEERAEGGEGEKRVTERRGCTEDVCEERDDEEE